MSLAENIMLDECTCTWGYEAGHDMCLDADPDCVLHGCSTFATDSPRSREVAQRIEQAEAQVIA
jgi:hypothetical protein